MEYFTEKAYLILLEATQNNIDLTQSNIKTTENAIKATQNTKIDFLRDPVWGFIGVTLAVIFSIITIWLAYQQLQNKLLVYRIDTANNILEFPDTINKSKLIVKFEDNIIEKLYIVQIEFKNKGNKAIEKSNYEEPISIEIGNSNILSANILNQPNAKVSMNVEVKQDKVTSQKYIVIEPCLLNKNESFKLQMLADNLEDIKVFGRISDTRITKENKSNLLEKRLIVNALAMILYISAILLTLLIILFIVGMIFSHP